jgi:hypothetical protein
MEICPGIADWIGALSERIAETVATLEASS